jgi:Arc/MetJ-type ribon-helix-helix transcriptional regulator
MARKIAVWLPDSVAEALDEQTRTSPFSRSELVEAALTDFLLQVGSDADEDLAEIPRKIVTGEVPSDEVDGRFLAIPEAPWTN